jgi:hypothetical protein
MYSRSSICILDFRFGQDPVTDASSDTSVDQIGRRPRTLDKLRLDSVQPNRADRIMLELDKDIAASLSGRKSGNDRPNNDSRAML